jgi:molybdopterin/thiamine biosynthesis adenylyltransferase
VLIDPKLLQKSDLSRNALYARNLIGKPKAQIAAKYVQAEAMDAETNPLQKTLDIDTDINSLLDPDIDLVINTADEPYIGATSIKLSRYCVQHELPLLVAGGFDAHLGSLSEMIIPGETPCSDCYATHFEKALKDWKPTRHPVSDRHFGFGGLTQLATFAASSAVLKIYQYFASPDLEHACGRGEFLFDNYAIDRFEVKKDDDCPVCGHL